MVSDIVLVKPLPEKVMDSVRAYVGCLSGATMRDDYLREIAEAGFKDVKVIEETSFPLAYMENDETAKELGDAIRLTRKDAEDLSRAIVSVKVSAVKK